MLQKKSQIRFKKKKKIKCKRVVFNRINEQREAAAVSVYLNLLIVLESFNGGDRVGSHAPYGCTCTLFGA